MADFITIAGVGYKVLEFTEEEALEVGHEEPTFSGRLVSDISDVKRRWRGKIIELTMATRATLFTNVGTGQHVTVAGEVMPASTTCRVKLVGAPYQRERLGLSFTLHQDFQLLEV